MTVDLSIVIPMKDEEQGISGLFDRLLPSLDATGLSYEVVCVDDGSTDGTIGALEANRARVGNLVIVSLSRNFGKEASLTAGMDHASGRAVIPIDADLQDPPELIPKMVALWQGGAEVVLAKRSSRGTDTAFKRFTAESFYSIINRMSEIEIPANAGDFRLMDRVVIDALDNLGERTRFNKGLFAWLGFKTEILTYERPEREVGESKWRYAKLWSFAVDGITSFSSMPLRIWSYIGIAFAVVAVLYAVYVVINVLLFGGRDVPGYASLMTAILFSTGMILTGLGVIGEYLSRVFIEVKGRPLYIVRKVSRSEHERAASRPELTSSSEHSSERS